MRNFAWTCLTLSFFFVLVLSFGFPEKMDLISRNSNVEGKSLIGDQYDPDLLAKLSRMKPDLVLLGNSMLGESVAQDNISKTLGVSSAKVWLGGAGSAWWYLVIKNILSELDHKPKYVGIFFRDNYLTLPQHKTAGKHKRGIDAVSGEQEPLLNQLAYFNEMNSVGIAIHRYLPLFNQRSQLKEMFEENLKKTVAKVTGLSGIEKVNANIAVAFDNARMNPVMLDRRQIADEHAQDEYRKDMSFHPENSFLAHIVRMCREQGVSLFFVRVKRVRDLKPHKQSPELLKYISQLNSYLDEQNIPLIDFTDNKEIQRKHYGKSDHLNRGSGRTLFTSLLAEQIKDKVILFDTPTVVDASIGKK